MSKVCEMSKRVGRTGTIPICVFGINTTSTSPTSKGSGARIGILGNRIDLSLGHILQVRLIGLAGASSFLLASRVA